MYDDVVRLSSPSDPLASTEVDPEPPWAHAARHGGALGLALTIVWYGADAQRVGHTAWVTRACTLGRGPGDGRRPRLEFVEQRPGGSEPSGSLDSPALSRTQLSLVPEGEALQVENVGRRGLRHNGVPVERARALPGDVLAIADTAVFLVELRQPVWPALAGGSRPAFAFGAPDAYGIVGESRACWQLRADVAGAAQASAHVLIYGPTGAGKELAARAVHRASRRAGGPLVSRNAATLPAGLIDAELFGNIKNYPNAGSPERTGLIGEADGGTLLLDEIGELPAAEQSHLLRALDRDGEYQRLGDARVLRADLRVVALTNRAPAELKPDLLARFPIRIQVPGLGERRGDVPLLVRELARELRQQQPELGERFDAAPTSGQEWQPVIEPELIERLVRHRYEGHHRELQHLIWLACTTSPDRYVAATAGVLSALAAEPAAQDAGELDRDAVASALAAAGGSPTRAAQRLGLKNRHVLYRLMKKHGLTPDE